MIQDDREFRLLVTIGSTLFPTLTNLVLSPSFLSLLLNLEVTSLVVQYGRANSVSHEGLDLSLDAGGNGRTIWKGNKVNTQEKGKGKGKEKRNEMDVMVMRYTDNLEDLIAGVDAVISHAGTFYIPHFPYLSICESITSDTRQVLGLYSACFEQSRGYDY